MALTNPILDELSNLSPGAQAALLQAHGATTSATTPAATPAPPAPMQAPGTQAPQIAPLLAQQKAVAAEPAPASSMSAPMSAPVPSMGTPSMPKVTEQKTPTQDRLLRDQTELGRKLDTGSGISQIAGKVEGSSFGQAHPLLGKIAGVGAQGLATIGDVGLSAVAPEVAINLPGTEYHHQALLNHDNNQVNADESNAEKEAQTGQQKALTAYTEQRPAIETAKLDQKQQAVRGKIEQQAAARGQQVTFDDDGVPTFADNPELQAYHTEAATALLHSANAEKAQVWAEIAKNKYVPGTPEWDEAQKKLSQIDRKISLAGANAGLRAKEFEAHAYGTVGGQELPGALRDASGTPVGTFNAPNVKPTTTERDAAGRANTMTAIQSRIEEGLKDPEILDYLGPVGGRLAEAQGTLGTLPTKVAQFQNDLISYGAFQAGLHPVRGIGALQYFDKVMGGLHQTPEELRGKLASNAATAGAVQQTGEMPTTAGQQRIRTAPNKAAVPGEGNASEGPKVGDVRPGNDGNYRFKGGDQYNQKNWERVGK